MCADCLVSAVFVSGIENQGLLVLENYCAPLHFERLADCDFIVKTAVLVDYHYHVVKWIVDCALLGVYIYRKLLMSFVVVDICLR